MTFITTVTREWREQVVTRIRKARRAISPSMLQHLDLAEIWTEAREDMLQTLISDGVSSSDISSECPLTLTQVLDRAVSATELIRLSLSALHARRN